ncbi:hypothetical protein [Maricaulis sp.]|uniref:hypothetical protein n=1 Tax=Maricaulis sp. TaxID=1486257 RepID=UPI002B26F66A|nr:hypothetical protein [Maricaulis sp.]
MAANTNEPLSPTVTKVLDRYLAALHADDDIDNELADRLDALLRKGKVPKLDDINAAFFTPAEGDNS